MMALDNASRDVLSLFNEKAQRLLRSGLVKTMTEQETGVTLSSKLRPDGLHDISVDRSGPDEEAFDALILTLRYFIQDNEPTSFRKMAELYERFGSAYAAQTEEFSAIRTRLNEFLDKPTYPFPLFFSGERLTRRRIMDVIVYGMTAHANPEKKGIYEAWAATVMGPMIDNEFAVLLVAIVGFIDEVKVLNDSVLAT